MNLFKNKYKVFFRDKQLGAEVFSFAQAAAIATEKLNIIRHHPLHDELAYMDLLIEKYHWFDRLLNPSMRTAHTLIYWNEHQQQFIESTYNGELVPLHHKNAA